MHKRASGATNLWSIIERLQRRLEGEGLARDVIDAAVVQAVRRAVSGPVPGQA
jgi:hypothetical protein